MTNSKMPDTATEPATKRTIMFQFQYTGAERMRIRMRETNETNARFNGGSGSINSNFAPTAATSVTNRAPSDPHVQDRAPRKMEQRDASTETELELEQDQQRQPSPATGAGSAKKTAICHLSLDLSNAKITERTPSPEVSALRYRGSSVGLNATTPKSTKHSGKRGTYRQHSLIVTSTQRSARSTRTPPGTPADELRSMSSLPTTTSGCHASTCKHSYVPLNGSTYSARTNGYVYHNPYSASPDEYFTPTQRAKQSIKMLKEQLDAMRKAADLKDIQILRLTAELDTIQMMKTKLHSPEERSASSDAVTVREAELTTSQGISPIDDMVDDGSKCSPNSIDVVVEEQEDQQPLSIGEQQLHMHHDAQGSLADSGHFDDASLHSYRRHDGRARSAESTVASDYGNPAEALERSIVQRMEEILRNHGAANTARAEALMKALNEYSSQYANIVPNYVSAKDRIRELEQKLADVEQKLRKSEETQNRMNAEAYMQELKVTQKASANQALQLPCPAPGCRVSITDLLHQLQRTQDELENIRATEYRFHETDRNHALLTAKEAISLWVLGARKTIYRRLMEAQKNRTRIDPEVTLQFLKSAVYYFLTDKENSQGHLQAIESILEFSEAEKQNIRAHLQK